MSTYRRNPITNDWVIFAPNRALRPKELQDKKTDNIELLKSRPPQKPDCPFCIGNESLSPGEVARFPKTNQWKVRIVENKFSSVDRNVNPQHRSQGLRREMEGFGIHDVVVDHPQHNLTLALMELPHLAVYLNACLTRYKDLQNHKDVKHVVLFKNQGIRAGGSLEHPHSQIYGLPVIPFETKVRLVEMERYYDFHDKCLLCDVIKDETDQKERIIFQNEGFVALVPYADLSPYHFWILPKSHSPSFSLISKGEIQLLAETIKVVFGKMYTLLGNPDFNFILQSLGHFQREKDYFHWYLSVIPQVKLRGGLEYAGGLYVNPVLPETAAQELREAGNP